MSILMSVLRTAAKAAATFIGVSVLLIGALIIVLIVSGSL
jgi:hypothetical protein